MRFVCVFEAVYVCVCAGQSKTGSIVKAFETLLSNDVLSIQTCSRIAKGHLPNLLLILLSGCLRVKQALLFNVTQQ